MKDVRVIRNGTPVDDPNLIYIDGCPTKVSDSERWLRVELQRLRGVNWELRAELNALTRQLEEEHD